MNNEQIRAQLEASIAHLPIQPKLLPWADDTFSLSVAVEVRDELRALDEPWPFDWTPPAPQMSANVPDEPDPLFGDPPRARGWRPERPPHRGLRPDLILLDDVAEG